MRMDTIDKKLLTLLQQDSKKTTKELSLKLNLSVTAVYERIKKLEREGIIAKYIALLDRTKIDK
ncbi:MAG TPA: winged helix-turn-helix transcriptional regulator, partial [Flavobacterium sp.]|nr:winged helix-turn-helix transcriptional regulator [Flavobacterium sp.]